MYVCSTPVRYERSAGGSGLGAGGHGRYFSRGRHTPRVIENEERQGALGAGHTRPLKRRSWKVEGKGE